MKVYISTAGCGYNQCAYLIRIKKSKNGYDYLCLSSDEDLVHKEGEIVEDLEDIYIEESRKKIEEFDIFKTFLFQQFYNHLKNQKLFI